MMGRMKPGMKQRLKQRLLSWGIALLAIAAVPHSALAQDDDKKENAWLNGYPRPVKLDEASNTLNWLLLLVIMGAGVGVMFKNAKRTHLD